MRRLLKFDSYAGCYTSPSDAFFKRSSQVQVSFGGSFHTLPVHVFHETRSAFSVETYGLNVADEDFNRSSLKEIKKTKLRGNTVE